MNSHRFLNGGVHVFMAAAFLCVASTIHAQDTAYRWSGVEVFGVCKAQADLIIQNAPIMQGAHVNDAEDNPKLSSLCRQLRETKKYQTVTCQTVQTPPDAQHLVIDLVSDQNKDSSLQWTKRATNGIRLDPGLLKKHDHLRRLFVRKIQEGFDISQRVVDNVLLSDDAELKSIEKALAAQLPKHRKHLINVLQKGSIDGERGAAAHLLNLAGDSTDTIVQIAPFIVDRDVIVRNNVSRMISVFSESINDPAVGKIVVVNASRQVLLPSFFDRNKSLFLIERLIKRFPELGSSVSLAARRRICDVAHVSKMDQVGGQAKAVSNLLGLKDCAEPCP